MRRISLILKVLMPLISCVDASSPSNSASSASSTDPSRTSTTRRTSGRQTTQIYNINNITIIIILQKHLYNRPLMSIPPSLTISLTHSLIYHFFAFVSSKILLDRDFLHHFNMIIFIYWESNLQSEIADIRRPNYWFSILIYISVGQV